MVEHVAAPDRGDGARLDRQRLRDGTRGGHASAGGAFGRIAGLDDAAAAEVEREDGGGRRLGDVAGVLSVAAADIEDDVARSEGEGGEALEEHGGRARGREGVERGGEGVLVVEQAAFNRHKCVRVAAHDGASVLPRRRSCRAGHERREC